MNRENFNPSREELEALIESVCFKFLENHIKDFKKEEEMQERWLKTAEAAFELNVSRQTLINWTKHISSKDILSPYVKKTSNNNWFEIEGIRKMFEKHPTCFSNGASYLYKRLTPAAIEKAIENENYVRYLTLQQKAIRDKPMTENEQTFYREQCKIRDQRCYLDLPIRRKW